MHLSFENGIQTVKKKNITLGGRVDYPHDVLGKPSDMTQHAYSAVFSSLVDQLVGSMGCYRDLSTSHNFSAIKTPIIQNALLGSNDLDFFFDVNHKCLDPASIKQPWGDQRLQDKALAKNQTLPYLIEDLFFNITISFMHNPLLA